MLFTLFWVSLLLGLPNFGVSGSFHLEQARDEFGIRSHGIVETSGAKQIKFYALPQSTSEQYRRLRPEDLRINPFPPKLYQRQEVIGPYQVIAGRLWFGNNYYHGEGMRGVGAFGYFDTIARRYTLYSPPEVAPYEISAILVQPHQVWLGLDQFGEDTARAPGGLAHWNSSTHATLRYPLEFVVTDIRQQGGSLRLQTADGYALFNNGEVRRFLENGKPISRFAPSPSHY